MEEGPKIKCILDLHAYICHTYALGSSLTDESVEQCMEMMMTVGPRTLANCHWFSFPVATG